MKGALFVAIGFLLLPGSVFALLASNFGALKGYLISAIAFFGFLMMLSFTWAFGLPGTLPGTGPKGTAASFKPFALSDPVAATYQKVRDFQGGAGNGWTDAPGQTDPGAKLSAADQARKSELDTVKQQAINQLIKTTNAKVKSSSDELDATNVEAKVYSTTEHGTEVAAVVISPRSPPAGSGLKKPTFQPVTVFAYRDPGAPRLPALLFLGGSVLLWLVHVVLLGVAERRRPLGWRRQAQPAPAPAAGERVRV